MKIIALGGSGTMGRRAVKYLDAMHSNIEIVVADINEDLAAITADRYGNHVTSTGIDVLDAAALEKLLSDADLVLNTVGPFFKFGLPILKAAISAKCDYVDINDDWEPTLEMLKYDQAARDAGITALINMGGSPGMTNLLGKMAINLLDKADTLHVCFHTDGVSVDTDDVVDTKYSLSSETPTAASVHSVQQMTGTVRVRAKGEFLDTKPLKHVEIRDLGHGVNGGLILGHPEPVTLPRYFPSLQDSACLVMGPQDELAQIAELMASVDSGNVSEAAAAKLLQQAFVEKPEAATSALGDPDNNISPLLYIYANGLKDGKETHIALRMKGLPGNCMADMTSIPMAVGASLLMQGKITTKGVVAPEGAIDPSMFFDMLAHYTTPPFKDGNELILVDIM